MLKRISLKTSDGKSISADYYQIVGKRDAPAVILAHMMPSTKESWREFAKKLNEAGFQAMAIDFRGHGESEGGPEGFLDFSDSEHQESIKDIESAAEFFLVREVPFGKMAFVGASIGANLSLQFQSKHPEVKASVLLSPGLNYRGIETEQMAKKLKKSQSAFFAAGGDNDEYSTETARKLCETAVSENKEIKILKNAGHGTMIFKNNPSLMDEIANWLREIYFAND